MVYFSLFGLNDKASRTVLIVGIISIILLVFLFLLLNKTYFNPKRIRKQVSNLDRRYEYLHALINGQDSQYVKRLERISRTNLLYGEKHAEYNARLKEIRMRYDSSAQNALNNLKDYIIEKNYNEAKESLVEAKNVVADFEKRVNKFNEDLMAEIKPEEDAKSAISSVKDGYRQCKLRYSESGDEIKEVAPTFNRVFEWIDKNFNQYDMCVESANYEEAKTLLPKLTGMIKEINMYLDKVPNLCVLLTSVVPEKLKSLRRTYNNLCDEGIPLSHLNVKSFTERCEKNIENLLEELKKFNIGNIQSNIDLINRQCDDFVLAFDKEKEARDIYNNTNKNIYSKINDLEKKFIKLCNTLPEVRKIYIIEDEYLQKVDELKDDVNHAGGVKRTLDSFIHSYSKQPYTVIVEKMNELETITSSIEDKLNNFQTYLDSLKSKSQTSYEVLFSIYDRTIKCQYSIREIAIDEFTQRYEQPLKDILKAINIIFKTLKVLPIDVSKINSLVSKLKAEEEKILSKIEQEYKKLQLADAAIIITNRHRGNFNEVDTMLQQAEEFYFHADFDQAYAKACDAEKQISGFGD